MKHQKKQPIFIGLLVLILVITALVFILTHHSKKQFAEPDKRLTNGSIELCSNYAKLCFARPTNWTRSSVLHAGVAKQNNIEINPPTGTILRFEAISDDTYTICLAGDACDINTVSITALGNGLNVILGVFNTSSSDSNAIAGHTPFIQLVSAQDLRSLDLHTGKSTPYTNFNPGVSFGNASKIMLQVSPGKGFDTEKAQQWLVSGEAATAKQILSSVRSL